MTSRTIVASYPLFLASRVIFERQIIILRADLCCASHIGVTRMVNSDSRRRVVICSPVVLGYPLLFACRIVFDRGAKRSVRSIHPRCDIDIPRIVQADAYALGVSARLHVIAGNPLLLPGWVVFDGSAVVVTVKYPAPSGHVHIA